MTQRYPMTTHRLYYDDARLTRFSATVVAVAEDGHLVTLDRTAFYPTSGGQPHDTGVLADVAVVDVIDADDTVVHRLAAPLGLPVGAMVVGEIDRTRRFDHMQQHTGQHLLSAVLHDRYGWPTVSVHFGDRSATLDIEAETFDVDMLAAIETDVNAQLVEDRPVRISYEDAATAEGLRKASDRTGTLRIVSIDGVDRSACGGTHVESTGMIGAILLRRAERTRGHVRLEFLCGQRAVTQARADARCLADIARPLSAAPDEIPALIATQQERLQELERERRRLMQALAVHDAESLWSQTAPDASGVRRIVIPIAAELPVKQVEPLAQALAAKGGCVALALTATGGVLLATSADSGIDAGTTLRAALQAHGGRGGGSPRVAQGTIPPEHASALRHALGF